jgi:hypothetical protein
MIESYVDAAYLICLQIVSECPDPNVSDLRKVIVSQMVTAHDIGSDILGG